MPKARSVQNCIFPKRTAVVTTTEDIADFQMLGSAQVAKIINFSPVHLRRLVRSGRFPAPRLIGGRKLAWPISEIKAFIDNLYVAQAPFQSHK